MQENLLHHFDSAQRSYEPPSIVRVDLRYNKIRSKPTVRSTPVLKHDHDCCNAVEIKQKVITR